MEAQEIERARVLVVGDVMLDRYWFGSVERISPEAPVPVVRVGRSEERLGGAANVDWTPTISFESMIAEMVDAQVAHLQGGRA